MIQYDLKYLQMPKSCTRSKHSQKYQNMPISVLPNCHGYSFSLIRRIFKATKIGYLDFWAYGAWVWIYFNLVRFPKLLVWYKTFFVWYQTFFVWYQTFFCLISDIFCLISDIFGLILDLIHWSDSWGLFHCCPVSHGRLLGHSECSHRRNEGFLEIFAFGKSLGSLRSLSLGTLLGILIREHFDHTTLRLAPHSDTCNTDHPGQASDKFEIQATLFPPRLVSCISSSSTPLPAWPSTKTGTLMSGTIWRWCSTGKKTVI